MATQLQQEEFEDQDEPEVVETGEGDEEQSESPPSEEKARRLGWKPKEDYKGPPEHWRDWEDFLNDDLSSAPQLRAQVKLLKRRLDQSDRRAKKMESTLVEAREYFSKAEERAYNRAVSDIRKRQREAVSLGDTDAFDEAEQELADLNKEVKEKAPKQPEIDPDVTKAFRKWERDNDWYGSDEAMTAVADRIAAKMGGYADNDMDPDEYLEELTARVKKEFPHKFQPLPKKRSAVEGVSETRSTKGAETFDNLPADAKAQFRRFEQMGVPVTKDQFTKDAWAEIRKEKRA